MASGRCGIVCRLVAILGFVLASGPQIVTAQTGPSGSKQDQLSQMFTWWSSAMKTPGAFTKEGFSVHFTGATIYGPDDENIGTVQHVHGYGADAQAVIDVGGFLGIGTKSIAVPVRDLDFMRDEAGDVHAVTRWTEDQLKDLPEHEH